MCSNKSGSTIYIGITNDLLRRTWEHKYKTVDGFTARYNVNKLVYYETFHETVDAIAREKELKGWLRKKKMALVKFSNPHFEDLSTAWK
ncbi:endonuclease [Candidatus Uhrbacteria bacterium RIFCSPLOWO2_02_FULL_49_11]|uniref:Endonuclease n=1 Tax=Candidatus Uhrbacteria bacterium RIFCSPLOWO2_02_FULL_49_11 TaxID=1802409 RepID=A0A1F7VEC1_9BACT|nr:MAG: endonuclease [Candidatus Uhrbacteria bacterium RIFCSPLOWO2_02_FULL_49_11]